MPNIYLPPNNNAWYYTNGVKALATLLAIPGIFMILIALGYAEADEKMATFPGFWSDVVGVDISSKHFFLFVGFGKLISVLGMHGLLKPLLSPVPATRLLVIPCVCAVYMHHAQGDSIYPAFFYTMFITSLFFGEHLDPKKIA